MTRRADAADRDRPSHRQIEVQGQDARHEPARERRVDDRAPAGTGLAADLAPLDVDCADAIETCQIERYALFGNRLTSRAPSGAACRERQAASVREAERPAELVLVTGCHDRDGFTPHEVAEVSGRERAARGFDRNRETFARERRKLASSPVCAALRARHVLLLL